MSEIIRAMLSHAETQPEQFAFVSDKKQGQFTGVTYRQLADDVMRFAAVLNDLDVTCVALYLENSIDWIIADLAIMYCQKVCVPVPHFFTQQQVQHVLDQAPVDLIISGLPFPQGERVATINQIGLYAYQREGQAAGQLLPDSAKVTFTSGSTGTPKGVCLSQSSLDQVATSLQQQMQGLDSQRMHLVALPLSTLLENITGVYVPLLMGVTSAVLKGEEIGLIGSSELDLETMNRVLSLYRPTSLVVTPALLKALIYLAASNPEWVASLEFVAVGGASVPVHLLQQAHALGLPAYEGYGLSEMSSVVTINTPDNYKFGTCGRPLPHCEVRLAEDGELFVKGAQALGYLSCKFEDEWLATGDIATIDNDGFISITGRKKNQIITSFGRNVSPEWVELQAQQWPALNTIFVVGEGDEHLSALIIHSHPKEIGTQLNELNQTLPDYAQITRFVHFDSLHSLITGAEQTLFTSNGRPVRAALQNHMTTLTKHEVVNQCLTTINE